MMPSIMVAGSAPQAWMGKILATVARLSLSYLTTYVALLGVVGSEPTTWHRALCIRSVTPYLHSVYNAVHSHDNKTTFAY